MKRFMTAVFGVAVLCGVAVWATAAAQERPVRPTRGGSPGDDRGAGTIIGTPGDDVIVGSSAADHIVAGPGDDVVCGEGQRRHQWRPGGGYA